MEVLCCNDVFSPGQMEFYTRFGITLPKSGVIYSIRDVIYTSNNSGTGLLLNEIQNRLVPIKHPILGSHEVEVNFSIKRFTTLQGLPLKKEDLKIEKEVEA